MAVSRRTQKDVGKFEAKLIGPFTTHQVIFVGIGSVLSLLTKFACDAVGFDMTVTVIFVSLVAGISMLLGFVKPGGMTATKYIGILIDTTIVNPGKRPYKSETDIDYIINLEQKREQAQNPKKKPVKAHKKLKEYKEYL